MQDLAVAACLDGQPQEVLHLLSIDQTLQVCPMILLLCSEVSITYMCNQTDSSGNRRLHFESKKLAYSIANAPQESTLSLAPSCKHPACMWQVPLSRLLGHLVYPALLLQCLSGQALQAPLVQHTGPLRLARVISLPAQWCCLCFHQDTACPCSILHNTILACLSTQNLYERPIKQNVVCSPMKQLQQITLPLSLELRGIAPIAVSVHR